MDLIITYLVTTLVFGILGYLLTLSNAFKEKKIFRIFSYIMIVILAIISSVIITDFFELNHLIGILAGCLSFWFYFGTRLKKDIQKKESIYKIKKILGIIIIIVGFITLLSLAMDIVNYRINKTPLQFLFIHFHIGISQLALGYALKKKHPFKLSSKRIKNKDASLDANELIEKYKK